MAGSAKLYKKPNVVVEEFESENSDDGSEDASGEEPGDDMVEIKEEVEDVDDYSEDQLLVDDSIEIKSEDDDIQEVGEDKEGDLDEDDEIKEENSDEEMTSDDMGDDSSGDSDSETPELKEKVKEREEKHVTIMAKSSDESDTDSDDDDSDVDDDELEKPEVKEESDEDEKAGLADVMAQILATPGGNGVMLSKARKDYETVKKEDTGDFEFVDADGNVKKEVKIQVKDEEDEVEKARKKLREKEEVMKKLKLKPNFEADREKERKLRIIATQGVVQLFSAMEKHKSLVRKERSETKSIVAREEISSSHLKASFLDILDEEGKKLEKSHNQKKAKREAKEEPIDLPTAEKKPKWSVFADNFYKEPTLQGWDLKSDEDE